MKKSYMLILIATICAAILPAQETGVWKVPVALFKSNGEYVLDRVELRDTATILMFHTERTATDKRVVSPNVWILDSQGRRYALKSADGIEIEHLTHLPEPGRMDFTLNFEPLPKEETVFDIIDYQAYDFLHYGVYNSKKTKKTVLTQSLPESQEVADSWQADTVTIIGQIVKYDRARDMWMVKTEFAPIKRNDGIFHNRAWVKPEGTFILRYYADRPALADLQAKGLRVPYYAIPGDTLYLEIEQRGGKWELTKVQSAKGYDTHESLLKALTWHLSYEDFFWENNKRMTQQEFFQTIEQWQKEWEGVLNYLSAKYSLTPWENHLTHERMRMVFDRYRMAYVYTRENDESRILQQNRKEIVVKGKENNSRYDFLRDVNTSDSTRYMIEPEIRGVVGLLKAIDPIFGIKFIDEQENDNKIQPYLNELMPDSLVSPFLGHYVTFFPVIPQEYTIKHLRENLMRSHQNLKMKCVYLIDREYEDMPLMRAILHELEDEEVLRLSDAEFGHIMETFNLSETESVTFDDEGKFCREPYISF